MTDPLDTTDHGAPVPTRDHCPADAGRPATDAPFVVTGQGDGARAYHAADLDGVNGWALLRWAMVIVAACVVAWILN